MAASREMAIRPAPTVGAVKHSLSGVRSSAHAHAVAAGVTSALTSTTEGIGNARACLDRDACTGVRSGCTDQARAPAMSVRWARCRVGLSGEYSGEPTAVPLDIDNATNLEGRRALGLGRVKADLSGPAGMAPSREFSGSLQVGWTARSRRSGRRVSWSAAWRRARTCEACGAPLRRCLPRCPTPGLSPERTPGRARAPHTPADSLCCLDLVDGRPVVPIGKKRSGSVLRQAATFRQSSSSHSTERFHMRATVCLLQVPCRRVPAPL